MAQKRPSNSDLRYGQRAQGPGTHGKVGDGAIINTGASVDTVGFSIDKVKLGIEQSGRDPGEVDVVLFLFTAVAEERRVIDEAKPFATWFFVNLPNHPIVANQQMSPEAKTAFEQYRNSYYKYDEEVSHHAPKWGSATAKASFLDDDVATKFTLAGTPGDTVRQIRSLERLGIESYIFRVGYRTTLRKNWN